MEFKKRMLSDFTSMVNEALQAYKKEYDEITFSTKTEEECSEVVSVNQCEGKQEEIIDKKDVNDTPIVEESSKMKLAETNKNIEPPVEEGKVAIVHDYTKFGDGSVKRDIISCDVANSTLFESGLASSINQSFYNGETVRRRAKRRTGKILLKRKYESADEECAKRRRMDHVENYLKLHPELLNQTKVEVIEYENKIKKLEDRLKASEERQINQLELEKIRNENIATSMKLENEIRELQKFKESIFEEVKKLEEIKKQQIYTKDIEESILEEKRAIQNEVLEHKKLIEAEKTMLFEERIKMEEKLLREEKRLNEERIKLEKEKNEQLKRIIEERTKFEKEMAEKTFNLEFGRKLLTDNRNKTILADQSTVEHPSRVNTGGLKSREPRIVLPSDSIIDAEKRKTIFQNKPKSALNELFQMAKKEHTDKVNQSQLVSTVHFFTKAAQPVVKASSSNMQLDRIDAHNLYKRSIDAQSAVTDAKKYVPKTQIPHYNTEDDFDNDEKKFQPALFTKDPKLNYTVKSQSHEEIKNYFGNIRDIDVEAIFNEIENVSNYSPNKLRKSYR